MDVKKACEIIRKNKAEGFQQDRAEALMSVVDAIQEGYELQLPKVGRWIPHDKFEYECSECGYTFIADVADIRQKTPFDKEMELGYRAFTSYVRKGVQGIIDLKRDYFLACESREYAKMCLKDNEEMLERIFGRTDLDVYTDEEIARFRALADEIQKEIDEEVNADES